jgi:uncharacterized membrane protein YjgN (DUF898 family)
MLYVLGFICLGPIVFIACLPIITGSSGVALHFSLRSEIGVFDVFWLSLDVSHLWNDLMFGIFSGIPALLVSIFYCVMITPAMAAIFLAVAGGIVLLLVAIPAAVMLLLCGRDQSVPGAVTRPSDEIHHIYARNATSTWWLF